MTNFSKLKSIKKYFEISTTIGCTVMCDYCPQDLSFNKYKTHCDIYHLDFSTFKTCLGKLPPDKNLVFSGFAEPFLNNQTIDMLIYAFNKKFKIDIFTTLIGYKLEYNDLLKNISFEKFRIHLPSNKNDMNISVSYDYLQILKSVIECNFNNIEFVVIGRKKHKKLSFISDKEIIFKEPYSRAGANKGYPSIKHQDAIICSFNNIYNNVLLPNGDVVLCFNDFRLQHVLGNLLNNDYDSLYSSVEFNKVISSLKNCSVHSLCRECELAVPEDIPINKINTYSKHLKFYDFTKIIKI